MPFTTRPSCRFPAKGSDSSKAGPFLKLRLPYCFAFGSLITLLVLSSGSLNAEWVPVERNNQVVGLETVYVDPDTMRREGSLVTIWQLTDFRWMQGGPRASPRFLSTKTQKQFECVGKRVRLPAYTEFSHRMATGKASGGYADKDIWLPVEPDQALWEVACGKL